jgi:S-adenosyl-L-methionine hydrolase (adenosine-forming)
MPDARPIVFETDFGLGNEWVGICHAVMSRIAPSSRIIDLSHLVRPLDVGGGARLLVDSLPYLPEEAILLAVVDPNVGKDRDLAVQAKDGRLLVGPDNGLLSPAWSAGGGVELAVEITSPEVIIEPVAPSLHARDVLCPAAAHLAAGVAIERLGDALEPSTLTTLDVRDPEIEVGKICCEVIDYNRFGNIQLNVRRSDLALARLENASVMAVQAIAGSVQARHGETYADFAPGEYGVILDPRGWLTIVRGNPGNALEDLSLSIGDLVWITDGAPGESGAQADR